MSTGFRPSIRRKRKPDAYHLNIVRESSGSSKKSRDVRIERVSIPFSSQVRHSADSARNAENPLLCLERENPLLCMERDVSSSLLGCDFQGKPIYEPLNLESDIAESNGQQSAHEKRKRKAAMAWEFSRPLIFRCAVECSALPKALCQHCNKANSSVYCKQCGPRVYYCVECAVKLHTTKYVLHSPQLWKVSQS